MKYRFFLICLIITFLAEISVSLLYINSDVDLLQDPVEINEAVWSVQRDWGSMDSHRNETSLEYAVLDKDGKLLYSTGEGLSESVNEAVIHGDTILDININGEIAGKIIIYGGSRQQFKNVRNKTAAVMTSLIIIQLCICAGYSAYLYIAVIKPFEKLKGFAQRVAGGNLDIPLEMDRKNIFGAFTESFDIMRCELKKARLAQARADAEKKELAAKLSHDIRTPVASIKAASEVGAAIAENENIRRNYSHIIQKADQINVLVTNLFSATLEELQQLSVEPSDMESGVLYEMLLSSDYLHYAQIPPVPECMIYADRIRLQQVFDNIFANSYKYADTEITADIYLNGSCLNITIKDLGGGVSENELPFIKEKFRRGENAEKLEGAGLGLYISDCFMKEMRGGLIVENGKRGLEVTVRIMLSGTI